MTRQEILDEIEQTLGLVPGQFAGAPDYILERWWSDIRWLGTDTELPSRDKIMVAFGAAAAIHCEY